MEGETWLFVQCSYGIGIRSGKSKRPPPGHRKTNARSRHATPRRARLMRWCAASCQSRAVLCRASLASLTARSRTPTVNSGRSLRCSANSNNRTVQPQPSTAVAMRRTSSPSGPKSESIQIMYTQKYCAPAKHRAPMHPCTLRTHAHCAPTNTMHSYTPCTRKRRAPVNHHAPRACVRA